MAKTLNTMLELIGPLAAEEENLKACIENAKEEAEKAEALYNRAYHLAYADPGKGAPLTEDILNRLGVISNLAGAVRYAYNALWSEEEKEEETEE